MKKVYLLQTKYTNGKTEINCIRKSRKQAEKEENWIKGVHELGDYVYESSEIKELDVEDDAEIVNIDGREIFIL